VKKAIVIFFLVVLIMFLGFIFFLRPKSLTDGFMNSERYESQVEKLKSSKLTSETTLFLGNSLVVGFDLEKLPFPSQKWAIGGDVLDGLVWRLELLKKSESPKNVVINLGVNDIINGFGFKIEKIQNFVSEAKKAHPKTTFWVMSMSPENLEWGTFTNPTQIQKKIIDSNIRLKKFCNAEKIGYIDVYSLLQEDYKLKPEYTTDGLHLTQKGYEQWVLAVVKALDEK